MYLIKDREDLEKLNDLLSLSHQVKAVRLQDKLGKQNFHEHMTKNFEPMTDIVKNVSIDITKTIRETSIENNKAISDINDKIFELMNDKCMIAPYLTSSLKNLLKIENTSQFNLIKDRNSISTKEFFINKGIPVTLYSTLLTFKDSNKSFLINGDVLKTIPKYDFNVSFSNF